MIYIGIDPGLHGGIAGICRVGDTWMAWAAPLPVTANEIDGRALADMLRSRLYIPFSEHFVCIEKVASMPKQGVASTFKFGCGYGIIRGVVAAMCIPVQLVTPQAWKKKILAGLDHDKDGAIGYCSRRWPLVNLVQPRCRKPHDGMADALCLAEYGAHLCAPIT